MVFEGGHLLDCAKIPGAFNDSAQVDESDLIALWIINLFEKILINMAEHILNVQVLNLNEPVCEMDLLVNSVQLDQVLDLFVYVKVERYFLFNHLGYLMIFFY